MTKTGVVVTIDATDHYGKMMSRTAQVFVSQSDADAGFSLAAAQIAEFMRYDATGTIRNIVPMTLRARLSI